MVVLDSMLVILGDGVDKVIDWLDGCYSCMNRCFLRVDVYDCSGVWV